MLIAGTSVRAASQSARRAGVAVTVGADMFGDQDLRECVPHWSALENDYGNLVREAQYAADTRRATHWMYTGGLENHPLKVDAVPLVLLGNPAAVLQHVRNPWTVARVMRRAGLPAAELASDRQTTLPWRRNGWLRKPILSGAGFHIEEWRGAVGEREHPDRDDDVEFLPRFEPGERYLQSRIEGQTLAGTFIAAAGQAVLLGVTVQLSGMDHGSPRRFGYVGSYGPVPLDDHQANVWIQIGNALASQIPLSGLFGVDAVDSGEELVTVEVNPRYPASVEVIERVSDVESIRFHIDACLHGRLPPKNIWQSANGWAGKRYVFTDRDRVASSRLDGWLAQQASHSTDRDPQFADLPTVGSALKTGAPIATVLTGPSKSSTAVLRELSEQADRLIAADW